MVRSGWRVEGNGRLKENDVGRLTGLEIDADHVETGRRRSGETELADVAAGEAEKRAYLVRVDGGFGGFGVAGGAGFDFDETEGFAVPGDEIEIAGGVAGAPAAGDDAVTATAEEVEGGVFSGFADGQMQGQLRGAPALVCKPVE